MNTIEERLEQWENALREVVPPQVTFSRTPGAMATEAAKVLMRRCEQVATEMRAVLINQEPVRWQRTPRGEERDV